MIKHDAQNQFDEQGSIKLEAIIADKSTSL